MNVWNIIEAISIFVMFACIVVLAVINERLRRALEWELEKNTRRIRAEQILKEEAKKPPCILRDAPTIDAVPVVRCKDCKHFADDYVDTGFGPVPAFSCDVCELYGARLSLNHYCAYGEREDDETD